MHPRILKRRTNIDKLIVYLSFQISLKLCITHETMGQLCNVFGPVEYSFPSENN